MTRERESPCAAADIFVCFFFQAEDGIRDLTVTGVQTCALPIFLGLSFVRRAADIERLRASIDGAAPIVAKIEHPEALTHIDEIVRTADAVMVARGDRKSVV